VENITKYILLISLAAFGITAVTITSSLAQEIARENSQNTKRHSIFLELAGNGGFYSLNYSYNITQRLSARIGAEVFPPAWVEESKTVMGIPILVNYQLIRIRNHHMIAGIGTLLATNGVSSLTGAFAYELHVDNRAMLRLGFTPHLLEGNFEPWAGLGVGFIF